MNQEAIGDQEAASDLACGVEAGRNGFTRSQAALCEDGMLSCISCPFRQGGIKSAGADVAVFESIIWFSVAARMPDGDTTVQLFDRNADEPVWPGYFDGEEWIYVDGNRATPSHWGRMPAGPGVVVASADSTANNVSKIDLAA
jgi:hypothetical protein